MALNEEILIRPVESGDRLQLTQLIYNESSTHRHLDWRSPIDWIGYSPYQVLEINGKLSAVLACPPDPPGIAWIRVFAVKDSMAVKDAWGKLWMENRSWLMQRGKFKVAAISLQPWFNQLLESSGFNCSQRVVMLNWNDAQIPAVQPGEGFQIRSMDEKDILEVEQVDKTAFLPLWQNPASSLSRALNQAAVATVAVMADFLVGYQITTVNPMGGHLARLAVVPEKQGHGIGRSLIIDMIQKLKQKRIRSISVNTQDDNAISLSIYKKLGFVETGESLPVYEYDVDGDPKKPFQESIGS